MWLEAISSDNKQKNPERERERERKRTGRVVVAWSCFGITNSRNCWEERKKKTRKPELCWRYTPITINWKELSFQLFDLIFFLLWSPSWSKGKTSQSTMPTYLDMTTFNVHQVEEKSPPKKNYTTLRVCVCVCRSCFSVLTKKIPQNKKTTPKLVFKSWRANRRVVFLFHLFIFVICVSLPSISYFYPVFVRISFWTEFLLFFVFSYLHLMLGRGLEKSKGGRFLGRHFEFGSRSRRGWSQSSHGHDIGASSSTPNTCTRGENSIPMKTSWTVDSCELYCKSSIFLFFYFSFSFRLNF